MSNVGRETTETYRSSLGTVNITSFDAMQEIAINESGGGGGPNSGRSHLHHHHHRPATLPLEPSLSTNLHSNDIISSSSLITAPNLNHNHHSYRATPIDALKEWSVSTYKCTKQLLNEKLGKVTRTVDTELEGDIQKLRETQAKYETILKLAKDMVVQYSAIIVQQNTMYECLTELAMKESKSTTPSGASGECFERHNNLSNDFRQNGEMMKNIAKNGEKLLMALNFFISNLSTLVYRTIEDTIATIRQFEAARLEYDAERNSLLMLGTGTSPSSLVCGTSNSLSNSNNINNGLSNNNNPSNSATAPPLSGATPSSATPTTVVTSEKILMAKAKYDKFKEDVVVKMKFLDENKAKVMHKQLVLFHNAFAAYASGNVASLDSTLKQFSIKQLQASSFLEK